MIESILIANRGEIAVRVVRACREMGLRSVVVYSEADRNSLAVRLADQAVCIGPPASKDSYLRRDNLLAAALLTDCDAVHPGVGFLSENAGFAKAVEEAGLTFIGPSHEVIGLLGDKVEAKRTAQKHGVPVIPGSEGSVSDYAQAEEAAREMGFPVIIKAAAGGGGKGMRIVRQAEEFVGVLKIASSEAQMAFSDGTVYVEKYLENPRHVELQIIGDSQGNVVHLGERDCSVQENHQKLIEESPSAVVTEEMRESMGADAVRMFKALGYVGAGTIEFLVYEGKYYFMEVNARVQVEHPVTELVTGLDIIKEQILVCSGKPLSISQDEVSLSGYAMECRINARTPGTVHNYLPPGGFGVRVDSFLYNGYRVSPHYDALVAKLLVFGRDRNEGIARMLRALDEFTLEGVPTNIDQQRAILQSKEFRSSAYGTGLIAELFKKE